MSPGLPWVRTDKPGRYPVRALTAAGRRLDLTTRTKKKRTVLSPWQEDAWAYRDAIGEIAYAISFLRNAVERCRVLPALASPEGGPPIPLTEAKDVPASVVTAATDALDFLTGGTGQWGALLSPFAENLEVPGEAYLLGRVDSDRGEIWEVRSTSELLQESKGWLIKDTPDDKGTALDPATTYTARLWTPHPRYRGVADSPMRKLLEPCEELALMSRTVRGAGRSRAAGAGLLLMPSEVDFQLAGATEEEGAPRRPFIDVLSDTMGASIADEGDAASLVPIMVQANGEHLDKIRHLLLTHPVDDKLLDRAERALARIGGGLDVPPEIVTGMAAANHWTAWSIDESAIRQHVEPLLARMLDAITASYLRDTLPEYGVPPEWARRIICWYDISPLTLKANRSEDALKGHAALVLSNETLVRELGYDPDTDMPSPEEVAQRLALTRGAVDSPMTEALVALLYAQLDVARTIPPGQVTIHTGQDAQDIAPPSGPAPQALPAAPVVPDPAPAPDVEPDEEPGTPGGPIASSAAPGPVLRAYPRESRRLMDVDRALRDRLTAVTDAALARALERAGNRARTLANKTPGTRALAAEHRGHQLVAALLAAGLADTAGVDVQDLVDGVWGDVEKAWTGELDAARVDIAASVEAIAPGPVVAAGITDLMDRLSGAAGEGLTWLLARLRELLVDRLTTTDPDADPQGEAATPTQGRLTALIRGALGIAGGVPAGHGGVQPDGRAPEPGKTLGGPGTGHLVSEHLTALGAEVVGYEWVYGISRSHFEPHRALDGAVYADHSSPLLLNPGGADAWPGPLYTPGDHDGCQCDEQVVWADGTRSSDQMDAAADATYDRTYLTVIEAIADGDDRAGRTGTSAQQTRDQARHVAGARPSREAS